MWETTMNRMKKAIASVCVTLCVGSPLALAVPPDQMNGPQGGSKGHGQGAQMPHGQDHKGGSAQSKGNQGNQGHGGPQASQGHGKRLPPQDFSPVRETIRAHKGEIGRGSPLPPGLVIAKGKPLPHGYGKPLPPGIAKQLPRYEGYEWRRLGTDMVLIAITTGIVYEVLHNVLD